MRFRQRDRLPLPAGGLSWAFADDYARLSLAVTNPVDRMPAHDPTYTAYPYYDVSWFDAMGRSVNVQFTYKLGGSKL